MEPWSSIRHLQAPGRVKWGSRLKVMYVKFETSDG